MAENQSGAAVEEQEFEYAVRIEDAGPATKRVFVEIPAERIVAKLQEQYKDLRQQAAIPGFRPGHAPQKLIEKRFSSEVKEEVRRQLVAESYEQAVQKNNLAVIGEPKFDNPDAIQLPESGAMTYSFEVEVQPEFALPELKGIKVKRPKLSVTEQHVDQAMRNLQDQQGTLIPVEDRGAEPDDQLTADVHVKVEGTVVGHQHHATILARPGNIGGIQIDDLPEKLKGLKVGETRTIPAHVPEDNPTDVIRGKDVEIEITLKDLKHLEPAEINQEFLDALGFAHMNELRDALREQMEQRISSDVQQALREQVKKHLVDAVQIDLPAKLSDRQADRVVQRRAVDLMVRGVPREQIEANVARLRSGAREEAARELKLFFVLQKIAEQQGVDVDEAELNGQIAMIAMQSGQRPEKLKHEMARDGTLANLYVQLRENKAIDKILETADIEEVDVEALKEEQKTEAKEAEPKKTKKQAPAKEEEAPAAEATEEPAQKKPAKRRAASSRRKPPKKSESDQEKE